MIEKRSEAIEQPAGVREVREWRRKVQESWAGKSREEILRELNEAGDRMREDIRKYQESRLAQSQMPDPQR